MPTRRKHPYDKQEGKEEQSLGHVEPWLRTTALTRILAKDAGLCHVMTGMKVAKARTAHVARETTLIARKTVRFAGRTTNLRHGRRVFLADSSQAQPTDKERKHGRGHIGPLMLFFASISANARARRSESHRVRWDMSCRGRCPPAFLRIHTTWFGRSPTLHRVRAQPQTSQCVRQTSMHKQYVRRLGTHQSCHA